MLQEEQLESMKAKNRTISHDLEEALEKLESAESQLVRRAASTKRQGGARSRRVSVS